MIFHNHNKEIKIGGNRMKEELITFKTAILAKEKGFEFDAEAYYNQLYYITVDCCEFGLGGLITGNKSDEYCTSEVASAPTQSLLQKWLLEKHNTLVYVTTDWVSFQCWISTPDTGICEVINTKRNFEYFGWYGDAFEAGLKEALKLIR